MANYSSLKSTVTSAIKTNGNKEITGAVLQSTLLSMIDSLGANYQFAGIANPSINPGTPDAKVFYLAATPGTYTNFGGLVLGDGEVAVLKWDTTWHKDTVALASQASLNRVERNAGLDSLFVRSLDSATRHRGAIAYDGTWSSLATGRHVIIPVKSGDLVQVLTASSGFAAVVTDYVDPVAGQSLMFSSITGYTSRLDLGTGVRRFVMPSDAKYFVLVVTTGAGSDIPVSVLMLNDRNLLVIQDDVNEEISKNVMIGSRVLPYIFSLNGLVTANGSISVAGLWDNVNNATYEYIIVPVTPGQQIHIKAGSSYAQFSFLKSYTKPVSSNLTANFSSASGFTERISFSANQSGDYVVPSDVTCMMIQTLVNSVSWKPVEFSIDGVDLLTTQEFYNNLSKQNAGRLVDLDNKYFDLLSYLSAISPTIIKNLMYDGTKFVSGNAQRCAAYQLCEQDTTIEVTGTLSDTSKPAYLGIMSSVPAIDGTMQDAIIVNTTGAFDIRIDVPAGKYFCFAYHETYVRDIHYYKRIPYDLSGAKNAERFYDIYDDRILDVEYSALTSFPNTILYYSQQYAAGFRAFKADMRLTSDNKIVLCHDAGFTLDGNGRITSFDAGNNTPIRNMTFAQVKELEFAIQTTGGDYVHPGTLDEFLAFCKQKQCVPYLTFRAEYISDTMDALWDSLLKYKMESKAIINLFPAYSPIIAALRTKQENWLICDTRYTTEGLSQAMIDNANALGCVYLCLYQTSESSITDALVRYASAKNVRIWLWGTPADPATSMANGVTGFQNYTLTPFAR